jgi:hypothetical protein
LAGGESGQRQEIHGTAYTGSKGRVAFASHGLDGHLLLLRDPEGGEPRVVVQTKPECTRKQKGSKNVINDYGLERFSAECRSCSAHPPWRGFGTNWAESAGEKHVVKTVTAVHCRI